MATANDILTVRENIGDTISPYRITDSRINAEIDNGSIISATVQSLLIKLATLQNELKQNESDKESEIYHSLADQLKATEKLIDEYKSQLNDVSEIGHGVFVKTKKPCLWGILWLF